MFAGVLRGSLIATLSALVLAASASAGIDSTIAPTQSTSLPVGHGEYFYVASSAGEASIGSISWVEGQDLAVSVPGGSNQAISIGHSSSNNGSFSTASARTAIAAAGLDGYNVVQAFSAQHSKAAHKATRTPTKPIKGATVTLPLSTASANEIVVIVAGGQGTGALELIGAEATALENATYGPVGPGAIASAAVYTAQLPAGKHKLKLRSTTYAPNAGTSLGVVAYVLAPAPAPSITSVSPSSGPQAGGTPVLIAGTDLDGATAVKFGGSEAASFKVASPTSIEAVSPAGSGTVDVTITGPNGQSSTTTGDQFTYIAPHAVDAYSNYGPATVGHAMCRGNPGRPESMPGGSATQTFTVPAGIASLSSALIQIDPDSSVTAHLTLSINGTVRATTEAAAAGDTHFSWPAVAVSPGDQAALTISFTATFGKIITIYSAAQAGGTLTYSNSCSDGAPSGSTLAGLRAVVSGNST
ncbi:MAG TPA: IPT/TIG domain-containing protein [Solirubrobacteraceae bacterium]